MKTYILIDMWSDIRADQVTTLFKSSFPVTHAGHHAESIGARVARLYPDNVKDFDGMAKFSYDFKDDADDDSSSSHTGIVVVAEFTDKIVGVVLCPESLEFRVIDDEDIWRDLLGAYDGNDKYIFRGRSALIGHQGVLDTYEVVDTDGISYERWRHEPSGHEVLVDIEINRHWNKMVDAL